MVTAAEVVLVVRWWDAHADRGGGWILPEQIDADPYVVTSIGWRIDPKPGHISIAQSRGDDGALDHVLHVPEGMIVEVVPWPSISATSSPG